MISSNMYDDWIAAKKEEKIAVDRRRDIEDVLSESFNFSPDDDGTKNILDGGYKIKITLRIDQKIDSELLQDLAREVGISDQLPELFRWRPEVNKSQWKATDSRLTDALLGAITSKAGRPSYQIEKIGEK